MPGNAESSSAVAELPRLGRLRRSKDPILETDLNPPSIPSIIQSTRCKSSVSSLLLLSTCSGDSTHNPQSTNSTSHILHNANTSSSSGGNSRKKNFTPGKLRGLGCAASAQVSVPAAIRTSADWQAKKVRKKKQRSGLQQKRLIPQQGQGVAMGERDKERDNSSSSSSVVVVPDIWCGPGIGFSAADAAAASVDCVVSRRPLNVPVSGRGKIDGDKVNHRERSCNGRRSANSEHISLLDADSPFGRSHQASDVFEARYYRHVRHHSPEGLAEIMLFRSSLLMGGRFDSHDRYHEWRLDVDNMTYEELLELGDRIGYVNTGLKDDEIGRYLRKTKLSILSDLPFHSLKDADCKCSICQEEYEAGDEMGKLECGHGYHIDCIKQWLAQKKTCPVCKIEAAAQK